MADLKVMELYNRENENTIDSFSNKTVSSLKVTTNYEKVEADTEWLDMMEDTVKYIDNILRNPNRFIVNEEDIVKIELARRVTVESIKHLSRNTNLIQDYDKKTGDVKPSKILNINKEESYNTYENRFIYSLIQNMKNYINRKKSEGVTDSSLKDDRKFEYTGNTKLGEKEINVKMEMNSKLHSSKKGKKDGELPVAERIEKLETQISMLTGSDVYKTLAKLHVAMVTSPIKKTNLILKNVNFQYALKLWDYMQSNMDASTSNKKENKNYEETGIIKDCVDETFLLNYIVMNSINKEELQEPEKKEISEKLVGNMIEQIVSLNSDMKVEDLKNIVGKQYEVIKYKYITSDKKITEIFRNNMTKYLSKINDLKI